MNIENVITNTFIARGEGVYGDVKGSNTIFSPNQSVAISEIEFIDSFGNKIDFVIPKLVKASIKSSSTLTPEVAYTAANLFDCKKDFGWAENVAGNGIGESITIKTATSIEYNKVKIWNGYQRSSQHFNANGSVKELYITNNLNKENQLEKSNQDQVIALRNIKSPQVFSINERKLTDAFKFTLKDIYQGDRYEDVLISEIRLYEKNVPVILLSDEAERIVESNIKEKTSHKVLASILDRNMSVRFQEREEIEDTFFNKNK